MVSAWHFELGVLLNKWLKYLFPNLQNYPPPNSNSDDNDELVSPNIINEQDINNIDGLKDRKKNERI
jgi:hypothetical protein